MSFAEILDRFPWWAALKHGGLLIAPSKLGLYFSESLPNVPAGSIERLRRDVVRVQNGDSVQVGELLDTVLEELLLFDKQQWQKGSAVDASWSLRGIAGSSIKPRRIWLGHNGAVLPVFVDLIGTGEERTTSGGRDATGGVRLGIGRSKRTVAQVIEWLRGKNLKVAICTNGRQWRLIHAGSDYDAFCEWDIDLWFEEGRASLQVDALRILLGRDALVPVKDGASSRLVAAILASRKGQAELSTELGERVRRAVEVLIQASNPVLDGLEKAGPLRVGERDIYIAATRLIMRCVVILFAEARGLLPRDNPIYHQSYGLQGLREQLDRLAGGRAEERLRHNHSSWPRLISLFRLVYSGCAHEGLPVPRYGGGLFLPGEANSHDPILRALAAFEHPSNSPSDSIVHLILELLCRSRVKVQKGRGSIWVEAPVDFSDLSSEYIGILYEGLLDFELRRAPKNEQEHDMMVFLNIGDQPVLPFSKHLDSMTEQDMKGLLDKLKKSTKKIDASEGEEEEDAEEAAETTESAEEESDESSEFSESPDEPIADADSPSVSLAHGDEARVWRERAQLWAEKAVKAAGLVKYPRKKDSDPRVREQYNRDVQTQARALLKRIVLPGEWYLVRWGGTRKGTGTFYTRPQLAGPTARRTLQPLTHQPAAEVHDEKTGLTTVTEWHPKTPEQILSVKVCDPAMGSGSFLISALRALLDALVQSLYAHGRFVQNEERTICRLADGLPDEHPSQETLPIPTDHPEFEERLRARLKRHLVEKCIYGVDLDPLAVELARMALWVETMDRRLPFGFLDHKLKCGNALVGCWFDRFQDYPARAWEREGGDKTHNRFVHHYREVTDKKNQVKKHGDKWTYEIKEFRDEVVRPDLKALLESYLSAQAGQAVMPLPGIIQEPVRLHDEALAVFEQIHQLSVHLTEEREALYREKVQDNPAFQRLKLAFDTWCALWFWPVEQLELAPLPRDFLDPDEDALQVARQLAGQHRFFHWELEFPDVFAKPNSGFDAVIGNPPWEIQKPNSMEFFSNLDPLYRTYGKQEALQHQDEYFTRSSEDERDWIRYCARMKAMSNWTRYSGFPFGMPVATEKDYDFWSFSSGKNAKKDNLRLHQAWQKHRERHSEGLRYADPEHPFRHQGSADINTYKMFLEAAHALSRTGGRFGFIVPSGIYTDKGAFELRLLLLGQCQWTHLYAFQNERFVFSNIHHSFKMVILLAQKGGVTETIRTRFRLGPGDSPEIHEAERDIEQEDSYMPLRADSIPRFSPSSSALLEIVSNQDLRVLEKLYQNGVPLGDQSPEGWQIQYATEFHMTNDSRLFLTRTKWEERGYKSNEYGLWIGPDGDVSLPLHQGIMIQSFDHAAKAWISGTGLKAKWEEIPFSAKLASPQYLISFENYCTSEKTQRGWKVAYRPIARTTDTRTLISVALTNSPAGNSLFFLIPRQSQGGEALMISAVLNGFVYDYQMRMRLGGTNLSWFVIEDMPLIAKNKIRSTTIARLALMLTGGTPRYASAWHDMRESDTWLSAWPWRRLWAITPHERLRLRSILDAAVADLYGLDIEDFAWILRDCDHPIAKVCDKPFSRTLDPKGFWRVDKEMDPELRHTVLSLVAFHDLKRLGLKAFLEQNDGEGWMLPETLRLADYGLGHDDRAQEPQPVASRLGTRFLDWQLSQGVEESWAECARHAEILSKLLPPPPPATDQAAMASVEQPATSAEPTAVQAAFAFALTPPEPKPGRRRPAKN